MSPSAPTPSRTVDRPTGTRGYFILLSRAAPYPFRGRGAWILAGSLAVFLALHLLLWVIPLFWVPAVILLGGFAALLGAYAVGIVQESANGETELPDWPDVTNAWDDLLVPLGFLIITLVLCLAPFWISLWLDAARPVPQVALIAGLSLAPMLLLRLALFRNAEALHPVAVVVSIARIAPAYAANLLFLLLSALAVWAMLRYFPTALPVIGPAVAHMLGVILLMYWASATGWLYATCEKQLDWGL